MLSFLFVTFFPFILSTFFVSVLFFVFVCFSNNALLLFFAHKFNVLGKLLRGVGVFFVVVSSAYQDIKVRRGRGEEGNCGL